MSGERTISATELQRASGAVMDEIKQGRTIIVASHGRPAVAMLPAREYELLLAEVRAARIVAAQGGQGA